MDAAQQLMSFVYDHVKNNFNNSKDKGNDQQVKSQHCTSPTDITEETQSTQCRLVSPPTIGINDSHAHCDIFYSTSFPFDSSVMPIVSTLPGRNKQRRQSLPTYLYKNQPNYKMISLTTFSKAKQHTFSFMDPSVPVDIDNSSNDYEDDSFYSGMDMYGEGLPFVSHATLPVPIPEEPVIIIPRSQTMPADQGAILRSRPSLSTLTPVKLFGRYSTDIVLDNYMTEKIQAHLPARLRFSSNWKLLYSIEQHGLSMTTMFEKCKDKGGCLLVIKDEYSQIFGAFLSEPFSIQPHYFGSGECFLWTFASKNEPPAPTNEKSEFIVFPWSGKNNYVMLAEPSFISVGGGDGKYGLWLDSEFDRGISSPCATFNNTSLCGQNPEFRCVNLEIWEVNP